MFAIVVNEKGGEQKRLEFDKPEVTIGRVQGNDIILPKGNVSKRHSRIVLKDGKFIIVDLKSTNGTYVNGRKITSPLVVKGSDKIYIGDFILSIEELSQGASAGPAIVDEAPPPPSANSRPRSTTIPPPPPAPRRPTSPGDDAPAPMAPAPMSDSDEAAADSGELPEPVRPQRPSQVPAAPVAAPAPLPPPAAPAARPSPTSPSNPAMAPRAGSRTDLPTMAPRPSPVPAPAPRPSPAARPSPTAARPPSSQSAPVRRVGMLGGDDAKRARLTEVMRELSARLMASLDITTRGPEFAPDEDLWARAESTAGQLVDQLNADGSLPVGVETDALSKDVVQEALGNGPLDELIADESVREIAVARHDRIFVDRDGTVSLAPKWFSSPDAVERALSRLLARSGRGRELEAARANGLLVEARIEHGLLLTAALPPLAARGPAITIRRPRRESSRLADLASQGLLSSQMTEMLELAMKQRRNIVVSGPAGSGRSTLLAALARAANDGERIVSVEEAEELDLGDGPWIQLVGGGRGGTARDAVHNALRLKPERLVIGDLRGAETLDVLGALAGGLDGCLCAVQAGSPREALGRLVSMARLAPEAPATDALNEEVTRGVHLIVQTSRSADGELRVSEIAEVTPAGAQPVFTHAGGRFAASGHVPAWAESAPNLFR
jgi:pilus assembly protein CpaF